MGLVFTTARGAVKVVDEPFVGTNVQLVGLDGWGGFSSMTSIITRCNVSQQGNFQFLHTLANFIYVYVFGDRMGTMGISGLAFNQSCDGGGVGVSRVLDWYAKNRLANRATPCRVTIGTGPTLQAFLIGCTADVSDPRDRIWQFDFQFSLIPPQS